MEIRDKRGSKNVIQMSRLENKERKEDLIPIQENFLQEPLFQVSALNKPWFADYVNFLIGPSISIGYFPTTKEEISSRCHSLLLG